MSLNERGYLTDFLICKVGLALVAVVLIGAVLWMSQSSNRVASRGDLEMVADDIEHALGAIDGMRGEVKLVRELPSIGQTFDVSISGTRKDGIQIICITVGDVEHVLMLEGIVNGGEFELHRHSPTSIHLTKGEQISLELI